MRRVLLIAGAVALALVLAEGHPGAASGSVAKAYRLSATMNTSQVVTPTNKPWKVPAAVAKARGTFTGRLDGRTRNLTWHLVYSGVGTPKLTIADIHLGKPGRFGQLLVRLCGPCKADQKGTKKVSQLTAKAITSGMSWITVITDHYPNGVIRSQITAR